ncbi:unnamed protein product [Vitrella brassicaformis CCMP3155]|uniref:COP9 signalosome complex subunit 4 n=1 Tax=Vitrella brassicaformis (strain CCMP3155) TaxID=1169540 RepID=A0A0G4GPL6_VITBC|nr:unnamed protein product [Vitrella brassicaformis CCMP3155]|eukprot:CEM32232.1 unnamed protein product [Vitrella brassicaformis CCMP3155]
MATAPAEITAILNSVSEASARMARFNELVAALCAQEKVPELTRLVDFILSEDSSQFALFSRPLLHEVAVKMGGMADGNKKILAVHALDKMRARVVSYEEEDYIIREHLAAVHQHEGEFSAAARCLAQINLESGSRQRSVAEKAEKYVKIAELFLEDEDAVSAEAYCTRASMIIHEVDDVSLNLRYKVTYARIVDSKRQFQLAANRYYDLSLNLNNLQIDEEDLEKLLKNACTCAILAPAGPQRSRLLAILMKDDRVPKLESYGVLKKMFHERIIRGAEVAKFAETLMEHQKASFADGSTVLDRAVLQHNVLAASKVYSNMLLGEFGSLLEVDPRKAEKVAARMILDSNLEGYIDQRKGVIHFGVTESEHLKRWDAKIGHICMKVNRILEAIEPAAEANAVMVG